MTGSGDGLLLKLIVTAAKVRPLQQPARRLLEHFRDAGHIPKHADGYVNGRSIALDLDEMVDQKLLLFGAFDQRGLLLLEKVSKLIGVNTIVDVGANIGNHTSFFADWAERVIAIEPNPPVFARLHDFISRNRLKNVTTVHAGLSDAPGSLPMYVVPGQAHLSSFAPFDGAVISVNVSVETGDALLSRLGAKSVLLIKIDVEGHERAVLKGLANTIEKEQPVLSMEWVAETRQSYGTEAAFRAALPGYAIYGTRMGLASRLLKTGLSLEPFNFKKKYTHILCVPEKFTVALKSLTG